MILDAVKVAEDQLNYDREEDKSVATKNAVRLPRK